MSKRKDLIRMKWRKDDTIRFYRDTPDKRGVSELVINNMGGGSIYGSVWECSLCSHSAMKQKYLFASNYTYCFGKLYLLF